MRSFIVFLCLVPTLLFARQTQLETQLKEAIKGKKAEIGIAVIIDGKDTVTVNNDIHYPLMSVFKFHQALALADYMGKQKQSLETRLPIKKSDLKPDTYSPLRDKYPQGGIEMSIADLLRYTLQQSDNNACDILFNYQGGPDAVNKYIYSLGIRECAIVGTETAMHEDLNNGGVSTGQDRLVAPLLNKKVTVGHKTGTGDLNAKGQQIGCNDIGFVLLPGGRTYSIAVFVKDSEENNQANNKIIANISRIVYEYIMQH